MKLIRFGHSGKEKPGIQTSKGIFDVSAFGEDYSPQFLSSNGITRLENWWKEHQDQCPLVEDNPRIGVPVTGISKVVNIGLNYIDHVRETHSEVPKEPIIFLKANNAINGPFDDVYIPKNSKKTDWEIELGVVIGKKASYVSEEEAMDYVAGYCVHNDYSEREFQLERSGQWVKGKSCDTFAPIGPWLVTKDEIKDVDNLRLWLSVNGKMMQDSNTRNLIFKIPHLISYTSQFMSLMPGDIISTGTPPGVAMGMNPPAYLKDGDIVECGIEGLGSSKQRLVQYK